MSPKDGQAIFADYTRYMEYSCHEIHGIQWSRGIWNAVVTRFMEYSVTKNRDRFLNSLFFEAWMSTSSAVQGYSVFFGFFSWASVCGGNLAHAYEIETKGTMEE